MFLSLPISSWDIHAGMMTVSTNSNISILTLEHQSLDHDAVIAWKRFWHCWRLVRGIQLLSIILLTKASNLELSYLLCRLPSWYGWHYTSYSSFVKCNHMICQHHIFRYSNLVVIWYVAWLIQLCYLNSCQKKGQQVNVCRLKSYNT